MSIAPSAIVRGAILSSDGVYRYRLWRTWDSAGPVMIWVMLNPSVADARVDDPTIRRCVGFARREGCGGIEVLNLYALCATDPTALVGHRDPEGPDNMVHWWSVLGAYGTAHLVVGWGAFQHRDLLRPKGLEMLAALQDEARCLGTTKAGAPRHPLFVAADAPLVPFEGPARVSAR